jgi:phenylpropionate dioxygenase-like ring-hydroxylating dioxygenase large terminal subunit
LNKLVEVGTYERVLGASLDRLIENALDWEHLPHLHGSSFAAIEVLEHGPDGWRAEARLAEGTPVTLDLRLNGSGWVTRTFSEDRQSSEIRSEAEATGAHSCRVRVSFFVAGVSQDKRAVVGERYRALYERLYDEDERMMIARAEAIRRGPAALKERRTVTLPDGTLAEAPRYCPHRGLPLDAEPDADGIITCPWHGYRIDIRTGRCMPSSVLQ